MAHNRIGFSEIARRIGITRTTAKKLVSDGTIPGGELLYRNAVSGRERWGVSRAAFEVWIANRAGAAKVAN